MDENTPKDLDINVVKEGESTNLTINAPDDPDTPEPDGGKLRITIDGKEFEPGAKKALHSHTGKDDVHVSVDGPEGEQIIAGGLTAVLIIFTLFVLPIWIISHYRSKRPRVVAAPAAGAGMATEDLRQLTSIAERLERRLDAMEALMDADNPNWRK